MLHDGVERVHLRHDAVHVAYVGGRSGNELLRERRFLLSTGCRTLGLPCCCELRSSAGTQVTMNWDNWGAFGAGNGFFGPSAQFVEHGSFVKLRNVSLTFTLAVTDNLEACITVLLAQHNRFVLAFRDEQSPVGKQAAEVLRAAGRPGHLEAGLRRPPEAEQEARVAAR